MRRYEIVAPAVDNAGRASDYAAALRDELFVRGIDGWTETACVGYWRGKPEPGTVFTLYLEGAHVAHWLKRIARRAMPDQEAIQIVAGETVILTEG